MPTTAKATSTSAAIGEPRARRRNDGAHDGESIADRERVARRDRPSGRELDRSEVVAGRIVQPQRDELEVHIVKRRIRWTNSMLNVDLTQAVRSHGEQLALVAAIQAAPAAEPETDFLEWKSELDLTTREGQFKTAKGILGFGNRDPAAASVHAGGCAYFVVGVEPGRLTGTTPHDPATVEQWLGRVVAPGQPQWRVDYVDMGGTSVMLITVEPPRAGDPIFTLRRQFETFDEGTIFVRRGGQTVRASAADLARLTQRANPTGPRIALTVERDDRELQTVTYDDAAADAFVAREAERLQRWTPGRSITATLMLSERRDPERYDATVAQYLERLPARVRAHAGKVAIDRGIAELVLTIVNETDQNFASTLVTLRIPRGVPAFFSAGELEDLLQEWKPPVEWGLHNLDHSLALARSELTRSFPSGLAETLAAREIERTDDGVIVRHAPVHVRPRTPHLLDPVYLYLPESYAGETLEIPWRATSTSADGDASGVLVAPVASEPVDLTEAVTVSDADAG